MTTYVTEVQPNGLKRIIRADGSPLRTEPPPDSPATLGGPPTSVDTWAGALERLRQRKAANTRFYHLKQRADETLQRARMMAAAPSGAQLAKWREAKGLTQRQLAALMDVSRGLIAEIERERRLDPKMRLRMAAVLGQEAEAKTKRRDLFSVLEEAEQAAVAG